MDGNNSDWLNDTVPGNTDANVENTNNSNDSNETIESNVDTNVESNENTNVNTSSIEIKEVPEEPKEIPTLSGMANKVEEEKELSDDEKYLLEYIGPNAEKLTYKVFSVPGFIFTSLYMFYRKTYLVGLITLLIQFSLMFFVHPLVGLIVNVIVGIFYNTFYLSHCNRKIEKIKNKTASKDFNNIINLCGEKGGINKTLPVFGFVLIIVLVLGFSYFLIPENKYSKIITEFIDNNIINVTDIVENM